MFHSVILLQLRNSRSSNVNRKAMSVISAMERVMRNTNAITYNNSTNEERSSTSLKDKTSEDVRKQKKKSIGDENNYKYNNFLTPSLQVFASKQKNQAKEQLQQTSEHYLNNVKEDNEGAQNEHSINVENCSENCINNETKCVDEYTETDNTVQMKTERITEQNYKSPYEELQEETDMVNVAVKQYNPSLHASIVTKVSQAVRYTAVLHQARELLKLLHTQAYQEDTLHSLFIALLREWRRQEYKNKCNVNKSTILNSSNSSSHIQREWEAGIATQLNLSQSMSSSRNRSRHVRGFVHEVNDVQLNEVCSDGKVVSLTEVELPIEFTNCSTDRSNNMRRRRETLRNTLLEISLSSQEQQQQRELVITSKHNNEDGLANVTNCVSSLSKNKKNTQNKKITPEEPKISSKVIFDDECKVYLHFVLYKEGSTLHEALQSLIATIDDTNLIHINDFTFNTRLHNDNFAINTNQSVIDDDDDVDRSVETSCVTVQVCSVAVKITQLLEWYVNIHKTELSRINESTKEEGEYAEYNNSTSIVKETDNTNYTESIFDACEELVQQLLHVNTSMEKCVIQPIRWSTKPFTTWAHNEHTLLESSKSSSSSSETKVQYSVLLRGLTRHVNHLESIAQTAASCVPNFFSASSFGPTSCPFRSYHIEMALSDGCFAEAMIMLLCVELWMELAGQETHTHCTDIKGNIHNNKYNVSSSILSKWQCDVLTLLKDNNKRLGSLKAWWSETFPALQTSLRYSYSNSVFALMWNILLSCRIADHHHSSTRRNSTHIMETKNTNNSNNIYTHGCATNKESLITSPLHSGDFAIYYSHQHEKEENTHSSIKSHQVNKGEEPMIVKYVKCDEDGWQYTVHDLLLPLCESSLSIFSLSGYHSYERNTRSVHYSDCPVYQKLFLALKQQQLVRNANRNHTFRNAEESLTSTVLQTQIRNSKVNDTHSTISHNYNNMKKYALKSENDNSFTSVHFRRAFVTCSGFPRTQRPWIKEFTEPISEMHSPSQSTPEVLMNTNNQNKSNTISNSNEVTKYSLCTDLDLALRNMDTNTSQTFPTKQDKNVKSAPQVLYPFSSRGRAITERLPSGLISAAITDTSSFADEQLHFNTKNGQNNWYSRRQKAPSQQSKCLALHFTLPSECSWHNYIREVCCVENCIGVYNPLVTSSTHERLLQEGKSTNATNTNTHSFNGTNKEELCEKEEEEEELSNTQYNTQVDCPQVDGNLLSLPKRKR